MAKVMDKVFDECRALRNAGQAEYAHADEQAFANFMRVAERMGVNKKQVLMVYMEKHLDGVHSFLKGHTSQREDVRGRINDIIVYACLLRGMIDEEKDHANASEQNRFAQQMQGGLSPALGGMGLQPK